MHIAWHTRGECLNEICHTNWLWQIVHTQNYLNKFINPHT
jgi:hypothetical protein